MPPARRTRWKCSPRFAVLSRLKPHENSRPFAKMRVYDGENIRETDPKVKTMQEYRDAAGVDEGMDGISTRFAYKVLSATFNHSSNEVAADPVHLMYVLEQAIRREQFPPEVEASYLATIKSELASRYAEFIGNEIQKAYLESYGDYGQNLFDRYLDYAGRLDRGPGFQGSRHRPDAESRIAQCRTDQDRKTRRHRQSQGLPQRGGEIRPAHPRCERRQEPVLDQLREDS